jgi:hypothetical protein
MNKFLLYLITTLHIIFAISLKAQIAQVEPSMVRFDYPEYIPVNSVFDVSLVIKFEELPTENVTFAFEKNKSIKVQSAYLNLTENPKKLFVKVRKKTVSVVLPFEDLEDIENIPMQIILKCRGKGERRIEGELFTSELLLSKSNEETNADKITRFYTPQVTAGNSILFKNTTILQLKTKNKTDWDNLYFEYWLKANNNLNNFFSIVKENTEDTLLNFSENNLGFLVIPVNEDETLREDVFLGNKVWNYLAIDFSKTYDEIIARVFVNSKLVYSTPLSSLFDLQNLKFSFNNNSKKEFELDRLKVWDFKDNIELAIKNKNFLTFEADSSENLLELNFDKKSELKQVKTNENFDLSYENIKYKKSNAPIFSKAPKLTVTIGSSYNSLIWYVQEYSLAKEFILEKAANGEDFKKVYSVDADDDPLKIYTYIDEVVNNDEVSFYRIRQINKDNSEVVSAEVKIGNKEVKEFKVRQNYPNPFNPLTNIYVDVITTTEIEVNVYDLVGNKVEQLYDGVLPQGLHTFPFDGSNLPSGIYFFEVASPHAQVVKKMILAK